MKQFIVTVIMILNFCGPRFLVSAQSLDETLLYIRKYLDHSVNSSDEKNRFSISIIESSLKVQELNGKGGGTLFNPNVDATIDLHLVDTVTMRIYDYTLWRVDVRSLLPYRVILSRKNEDNEYRDITTYAFFFRDEQIASRFLKAIRHLISFFPKHDTDPFR